MHAMRLDAPCGCDAPGLTGDLLPLDRAMKLALDQVTPLKRCETVALAASVGRVLAQDIRAPSAMPYFDNCAMDGFALRLSDLGDTLLRIAGTVAAGDKPCEVPPGQAVRVFTGAPLPVGADTVVMAEACVEADGHVSVTGHAQHGAHIRRAGSDQRVGDLLAGAGTLIGARHVGLMAANGIAQVTVARRPRVAVFSSGDELGHPGSRARWSVPDSNRPMLIALAQGAGAEVTDLGILPDDPAATTAAFGDLAGRFDLILSSGAVSMGGKDHIRDALLAAGGTITGWRVAVKPGKPVLFGQLGGAAFTGLPGNPFSAYVGFHLFASRQISRLAGRVPGGFATVPARAGFDWSHKPGRAEVFPVRLRHHDSDGLPVLERLGQGVSATLLPLADADGLALVEAQTGHVAAGDRLTWQPFFNDAGAI